MSFVALLLACAVLYGVLHFIVLPRLQSSTTANSSAKRVAKSGVLAGIKFANDLLFLAIIVYAIFGTIALVMGSAFANNLTLLNDIVKCAKAAKGLAGKVKEVYGSFAFCFFVCAFLYLTWRQRREALSGKTRLLYDLEEDRCNREREEDPSGWNALPPNEAMLAIDVEMQRIVSELPQFVGDQHHAERLARRRALASLKEKRNREDYARRVDQAAIDKALRAAQSERAWYGLLSKGFYADLKFGSKMVTRTATILAMLALVGIGQAAGINQILSSRLVALDDLRVHVLDKAVADEWAKGVRQSDVQQNQMTAEDKAAVAYLADQFARALLANPAWHQPVAAASSEATRRVLAREAILTQVSLPDPSGRATSAYQANLSPDERDALRTVVPVEPYKTRVGQELAESQGPEVKTWFGSRWEGVKKTTAAHRALYHDPLSASDVQQDAIDKVISSALKSAHGKNSFVPYGSSQASAAGDKAMESALADMVPTEFHRMLEDYATGKPLDEVFAHVRVVNPGVSERHVHDLVDVLHGMHAPDTPTMVASLHENPGGWSPKRDWRGPGSGPDYAAPPTKNGGPPRPPGPPADVTEVVDELSKANSHLYSSGAVSEHEIEGLAEYDDFFPKSVASARSTVLSQEISSHGPGVTGVEIGEEIAFRVERGASFSMLQGFSRVGGVLIGRAPDNSSARLDLRGLDWSANGRLVTLHVRDAQGRETALGPFDQSLVHQALAYAADGRPVAVTMTTAKPVRSLKVQLHPSLLDTPLGCRVSQLDRLVDTFTTDDALPEREKLQESFALQLFVYNYAWSARLSNLDRLSGFNKSGLNEIITEKLSDKDDLAKGLAVPSLLTKAGVMQVKPAFFDPQLVHAIHACVAKGADSFGSCVRERFSSDPLTEKTEDAWLAETDFTSWSGVRERPFKVTPDLSFLKPPNGNDPVDRLWPFDFMVQISFTTPAVNAPSSNDRYVDQDPLEFKTIRPKLQELVDQGIRKQGLSSSLRDLQDFAVLQRLFRLALNGNLGDQFPVNRLALLERETAGGIPYLHTARWQRSDLLQKQANIASLAISLQFGGGSRQAWSAETIREAHACVGSLDKAMQNAAISRLPECDLRASKQLAASACAQSAGKNREACLWSRSSVSEASLESTLKIERAFGVLDDQKKKDEYESKQTRRAQEGEVPCPPLRQIASGKENANGSK